MIFHLKKINKLKNAKVHMLLLGIEELKINFLSAFPTFFIPVSIKREKKKKPEGGKKKSLFFR